jgi:hypothetical protein
MASEEIWNKLKYFKKTENWGNADAISEELLLRLDAFRSVVGVPIVITRGIGGKSHSERSFHKSRKDRDGKEIGNCAVDVVLPSYDLSPFDLVFEALKFFNGVGWYPHWFGGGKVCGGLHLDMRPLVDGRKTTWMGILDSSGNQKYINLTFDDMVKFFNEPKPKIVLN